jgi:hypothetical protein
LTAVASVYCACGAQWHGEWVVRAADTIAVHRQLWQANMAGGTNCRPQSHEEFTRHYQCYCPECEAARRRAWTEKRQAAAARRGR